MTRGIVAEASRIIIVSGIQEGINIAARLFLAPGATCLVENPGYQGAAYAFEASGAEVLNADIDTGGLVVDALPERPVALAYVTPSHQYPTGFTLAAARRGALIAWARRVGCYILSWKTTTIATSATRARRCRRSPRSRPTAPSISARSRSRSVPGCGSATWWCPRISPSPSAP
jgi:hypothetical protein